MFNIMTKEDFDSSNTKGDAYLQFIIDKKVSEPTLRVDEMPSTHQYHDKARILLTGVDIYRLIDENAPPTEYSAWVHKNGFKAGMSKLSRFYRTSMDVLTKTESSSIVIELSDIFFPLDISFRTALNEIYELQDEYPDIDIILVVEDFDALKKSYEQDISVDEQIKILAGTDILIPVVMESTVPLKGFDEPDADGTYRKIYDIYDPVSAILKEELPKDIEDQIEKAGKPFSDYLSDLLKSKQLTRSTICHRGNLSRQYFSRLLNGERKNPSKEKLLLLAVAFQLNIKETVKLLNFMGYAFSNNSIIDIIFKYYINIKNYNIYHINSEIFMRTKKCLVGDE